MPFITDATRARFADLLSDTGEVYRDPDTTPVSPHANRDAFGFSVKSNPPAPAAQTGKRKVAEYPCSLVPPGAPSSPFGTQVIVAQQAVPHAPWIVVFFANAYTDGKIGDELHINGTILKVIFPGGPGTHSLFRLVNCQEVK